jgi:hypothetical protein
MRCPFDEFFGLVVPPAAGSHRVGAEVSGFAVAQAQAAAGRSKFTGVDGWAAVARAVSLRMVTPAAIEASSILRLVNMVSLPGIFCFHCGRIARPSSEVHAPPG